MTRGLQVRVRSQYRDHEHPSLAALGPFSLSFSLLLKNDRYIRYILHKRKPIFEGDGPGVYFHCVGIGAGGIYPELYHVVQVTVDGEEFFASRHGITGILVMLLDHTGVFLTAKGH